MAEFFEVLMVIYGLIAGTLCFVIGLLTAFDAEYETNILKFAFYIEGIVWGNLNDEINIVGLVIVEIAVVLFCLPANLLLLICKVAILLVEAFWRGYLKLFAKKGDG